MGDRYEVSGTAQASLGNAVSNAIFDAIAKGMAVDEASCIALQVAVDYYRGEYGEFAAQKLPDLVAAMIRRHRAREHPHG